MSRNQIKGITVKIGGDTTELGKALESVNKKSDDLSNELSEINRQLKFDPKNTELLAQKQKVLADAVDTAGEKLKKLKEAEKQVQEQFARGDATEEQVRALKREIIAAEGKMESYKKAAKSTAEEVENLGKKSEDTSEKMAGALSKGLTGVVAGLTAVATAVTAAAESTREYRTDMGKLATAYDEQGHSQEAATQTYKELQSVLGDSAQAVEAANHLAQLADNEEDLVTWTKIATGVYASFGSSLPIENLTEAANETAKTGAITGGLADALNWADTAGMDFGIGLKENIEFTKLSNEELKKLTEAEKAEYEARKAQYEEIDKYNQSVAEATSAEEKFQIALDNCTTEQERQALITSTLNTLYGDASAQYKETNADIVAANEANEKWTASLAEVGAAIEPLLTAVKEIGANLLSTLAPVVETISNNLPTLAVGLGGVTAALIAFKIAAIASTAATQGMTLAQYAAATAQGILNAVMSANPIGLIILGITALVMAVMAMVKNWDEFGAFFAKLWEGIKNVFTTVVDWIKENWQALLLFIVNPLAGVFKYCYDNFDGFREAVDGVFGKIKSAINGFVENLKALPSKIWNAITGAIDKVKSWGADMAKQAKTSMKDLVTSAVTKLKELPGKVISIGKDLVSGLWEGVKDKLNWLKNKLSSFATSVLDSIKDFFGVHSPSTETEWLGKMLDEGMAVGVEKNANEPIKAMDNLSSKMLTAASGEGDVAIERRISQSLSVNATAGNVDGIGAKLDQIYKAILSGQVIMLDGKTLVGSTAVRYDNELGQRRVLAERGAL